MMELFTEMQVTKSKRMSFKAKWDAIYWKFHELRLNFKPDLAASEWQAMRLLRENFRRQSETEDLALTAWHGLLNRVNDWPGKTKTFLRPSDIRRNLTVIIAHLNKKLTAEQQVNRILVIIERNRNGNADKA